MILLELYSALTVDVLKWNRYWIDFNKWEVFVNDDGTRTFLSIEVTTGGLAEVLWNCHCWCASIKVLLAYLIMYCT